MATRSSMNRIVAILLLLLMVSSMGVIFNQHEIRKLNIELDKVKQENESLKVDYGRLELEFSRKGSSNRLEEVAKEKEEFLKAKSEMDRKPIIVKPTIEKIEADKEKLP